MFTVWDSYDNIFCQNDRSSNTVYDKILESLFLNPSPETMPVHVHMI